jgi:hypothetical protein
LKTKTEVPAVESICAKRADSGVKTQRLNFFKGQNWRFCARFGGLCQAAYASQSRTESSPAALRSFCGSTGEAPPPPAASVALHLRGRGRERAERASRS